MSLLEDWRGTAYKQEMTQQQVNQFWGAYFAQEQKIYEEILAKPDEPVKGTVKELADKFGVDVLIMTGFLDGIESLKNPNPIETMDENTEVNLDYDKEKLYYNMVGCKADWLYELPQWDEIFDADKKKTLYREAKNAHTIRNTVKVGRNDPCPCGSGRKYKQCCGKKNK